MGFLRQRRLVRKTLKFEEQIKRSSTYAIEGEDLLCLSTANVYDIINNNIIEGNRRR